MTILAADVHAREDSDELAGSMVSGFEVMPIQSNAE
jgi:hypothetical protein